MNARRAGCELMRWARRAASVIAILNVSAVVAFAQAPTPVPSSPLREPSITVSPSYFDPFEEILFVEGYSEPNTIVTIVFQKAGEKPVKFTKTPDSRGEWVIQEKTYLSAGDWEVRARAERGSEFSDWSNPRLIRAVAGGISIFGLRIRYMVVGSVIFIFVLILASILFYFTRKIKSLKRGLFEKQVHETHDRAHEGFTELRRELTARLKSLVANADKRPLTAEEIDQQERILHELDELEQRMEHDIGDIEKRY